MIKVLYFARLREQLGKDSDELEPGGLPDLASVVVKLRERGGVWDEAFGGSETVLMAINQEVASPDTLVSDGDEVAFFPPVTGG